MPKSMREARDIMSEIVLEAWNTVTTDIYGSPAELRWSTVVRNADESLPNDSVPWGRVTFKHPTGLQGQSSLADASGLIKWNRTGILTLQCFAPISLGNAYVNAESMATHIRDVLQRVQACVWFRKCEAVEVGVDKGWFVFNASANFTYDEIQ